MPLHPAIVHIPVALALLLPLLIPLAAFLWSRNRESRTPFVFVAVLCATMAVSAFMAKQTGEDEEDTVETIVAKSHIHDHEEEADIFFFMAVGMTLLGLGTVAATKSKAAIPLTAALWLLSAVAAYQAYRTGEAGGELVYKYNAGAAYLTPDTGADGAPVVKADDDD